MLLARNRRQLTGGRFGCSLIQSVVNFYL